MVRSRIVGRRQTAQFDSAIRSGFPKSLAADTALSAPETYLVQGIAIRREGDKLERLFEASNETDFLKPDPSVGIRGQVVLRIGIGSELNTASRSRP